MKESPKEIYQSVLETWKEKFLLLLPEITYTLILILFFLVIRSILHHFIRKSTSDDYNRFKLRRMSTVSLGLILFLSLFPVWLPSLRTLFTFLGIFGAGVLVVSRDILLSLGGWIYLMIRQPFSLGDFVEIGAYSGEVKDIRFLETTLREYKNSERGYEETGRTIHVPNNRVFTDILINFERKKDMIYDEISLAFSYPAPLAKIESLINEAFTTVYPRFTHVSQSIPKAELNFYYQEKKVIFHIRYPVSGLPSSELRTALFRQILDKVKDYDDIILS